MRVFIGIKLSDGLQEKIVSWQENFATENSVEGIRFIQKENLHITLLPPWDEKDVPKVIKKLQGDIFMNSFSINFHAISTMPQKKPKYIWVNGQTPEEMLLLRSSIAHTLGRTLQMRPFALHTTIARLKTVTQISPIELSIHWVMQITSFTLFASHVGPKGAVYESLVTIPL